MPPLRGAGAEGSEGVEGREEVERGTEKGLTMGEPRKRYAVLVDHDATGGEAVRDLGYTIVEAVQE